MVAPDVFALVSDNRRRAAALFEGLVEAQWRAPSLCAGWTVRDVAGHLVVPFEVSTPSLLLEILRGRGSVARAMDRVSRRAARAPTEHFAASLREHADVRFTPPGLGPEAPLADTSIHLSDVARPLGLDAAVPATSWRIVLDFLASSSARRAFVPAGHADGLTWTTTDQAWTSGDGPEIRGRSEAVALALTGRSVVLDELEGPGVDVLRARVGA